MRDNTCNMQVSQAFKQEQDPAPLSQHPWTGQSAEPISQPLVGQLTTPGWHHPPHNPQGPTSCPHPPWLWRISFRNPVPFQGSWEHKFKHFALVTHAMTRLMGSSQKCVFINNPIRSSPVSHLIMATSASAEAWTISMTHASWRQQIQCDDPPCILLCSSIFFSDDAACP